LRRDSSQLCARIGYEFNDSDLIKTALTHRSASNKNNERLEFLGDSILGIVISEYLFNTLDKAQEGELSRIRASLVKGDKLAELANGIDLGDYIYLGSGELKSGGFRRASILADALEAIFGAVLIDAGYQRCKELILFIYKNELQALPKAADIKDSKTQLQEFLQSRQLALPEYEVVNISGEPHQQNFTVSCQVAELDQVLEGMGGSRRKAEQDAASKMLKIIIHE